MIQIDNIVIYSSLILSNNVHVLALIGLAISNVAIFIFILTYCFIYYVGSNMLSRVLSNKCNQVFAIMCLFKI